MDDIPKGKKIVVACLQGNKVLPFNILGGLTIVLPQQYFVAQPKLSKMGFIQNSIKFNFKIPPTHSRGTPKVLQQNYNPLINKDKKTSTKENQGQKKN